MKDNGIAESGPSDTRQPLSYSYSNHRALIAARCAASKRPFNSVADPYYVQEVEMLRPGTKLPSPATVSRDVKAMYGVGAEVVREYFLVCNLSVLISVCLYSQVKQKHNSAVHLVMDGWTSPILACYLGIVAIWFCSGRVHRCILEFARYDSRPLNPWLFGKVFLFRVKERHTGEHLANIAADCVKRYGLENKVR